MRQMLIYIIIIIHSSWIYIECLIKECERETTERVRELLEEIEDAFYLPRPSRPATRAGQSSQSRAGQTIQEKECQLWREHFPHLR